MHDSIRPDSTLDDTQRRELLQAMGIDVYLLRGGRAGESARHDSAAAASAPAASNEIDLVVASAADSASDAAAQRLRTLLPLAIGVPAERICWITAGAGGALPEPPSAHAYLALGTEMPRALGANLSTMQQMSATIAAADDAAASLRNGLAKRALWQALKPLARLRRDRN